MDLLIAFLCFIAGTCFGFGVAAILMAAEDAEGPDDPTYRWTRGE